MKYSNWSMEDNIEGYNKDNSYKIMLLICIKFKMAPIIWF